VDATGATACQTYQKAATIEATLTVTDAEGATDTVEISPGNTPPVANIERPQSTRPWKVGAEIPFSGTASDGQDGALPRRGYPGPWSCTIATRTVSATSTTSRISRAWPAAPSSPPTTNILPLWNSG
jgi:hypothetical protein